MLLVPWTYAVRKPGKLCNNKAQYDFVPFAMEPYGRLGSAALGFVNALGDVAAASGRGRRRPSSLGRSARSAAHFSAAMR